MTCDYALITGGAGGIGSALLKQCLSKKLAVVILDFDSKALETIKRQFGEEVSTFCLDLTDFAKVEACVHSLLQNKGTPKYLFNNAGIGGELKPLWQQSLEQFQKTLNVNFYSAFYLNQLIIPSMLAENKKHHIINIASLASFYSAPVIGAYVISKHCLLAYSECLYHDLKPYGDKIKLSVVCPAGVKTNILDKEQNFNFSDNELCQAHQHFLVKFAKVIKKGCSADVVAKKIFQAIAENKFYIFTQPECYDVTAQRFENILNDGYPQAFLLKD